MTINNETMETPRKLADLLKLESYADMTDEEIEIIMEYRIHCAVRSEEMEAKKQAISETGRALIDEARQQREHAQEVLESLVANQPQFYRVEV